MSAAHHSSLVQRLSRMLPLGNAVEQINAIVERADAEAYLQALPADVFFHMIQEAGWDQGVDLVPYASPEQLQVFLDLDAWRRDQLIPARMNRWMLAVVDEASDERFKHVLREMDPEVITRYVQAYIEVMTPDEEGRVPDEAPDRAVLSPDGMHVLIYPEDEDVAALMRALMHRLYELDRVLAWTLLEGTRWEMTSDLEEYALRWRMSRMEELGFVSHDEAMQVYRPVDPLKVRAALEAKPVTIAPRLSAPETLDLPAVIASELDERFLYVRALSQIEDGALLQDKVFEVMSLASKVMVADGIEPGELGSGRQVMRRMLGYMSLGLEFLSRGNAERERELVVVLAAREVFRAGYSLVERLQRQARQLEHRPTLGLVEGLERSLLNEDEAALMEGLMRKRPTFGCSRDEHELFESQEQLEACAAALSQLAFKQLWVFAVQRGTLTELVELASREDRIGEAYEVTCDALFGTWLTRELASPGEGSFEPLGRVEVGALLVALRALKWREEGVAVALAATLAKQAERLPAGTERLLVSWIEVTLERLEDELLRVEGAPDVAQLSSLLMLRHDPF